MKQYSHIWYLENRAKKLGISVDQYQKNRTHLLDLRHKRYLQQRETQSERSRKEYCEIKQEIFTLLGNKCSNPNCLVPNGCSDPMCLQIDHVNGGGLKEYKQFPNMLAFYKFVLEKIKKSSKDYQLLCANCNQKKRYEKGEGVSKSFREKRF